MKKRFSAAAKITLVLVYLVIVAGAMVRMTGSGMGCPDWPKCFGYYIPPTDIKELTWSSGREFEEGQVIIKDETLLVATSDFKTTTNFDKSKWRLYTKHDYAIFNPVHTWIEYVNRLVGAVAGISTLLMAVLSLSFWRERKKITLLSWFSVFLMGFQGWLGATVVYSVLNPLKITLHMIVSLVIVALLIYIIRSASVTKSAARQDSVFGKVILFALLLTLVQVILGTQVRQYVDEQVKFSGYESLQTVLDNPIITFYVHRSFSILVLGVNAYLFLRNRKLQLGFSKMNWIISLILIEVISGLAMYYFDFPFGSQAFHLVIASVLFGIQFNTVLEANTRNSVGKLQ